jgi:hypothetical protein
MGKFTAYAVAALALGSVMATTQVSAEQNYGPLQQNGKCWNAAMNHGQHMYGYWGECPRAARVAVAAPCPQDQERSSRGYCRPARSQGR